MLGFILGGVMGVALVRLLILDEIEIMAFDMFWEGIKEKTLAFDKETIVNSTTFLKSCVGFLVGGIVGNLAQRGLWHWRLRRQSYLQHPKEMDAVRFYDSADWWQLLFVMLVTMTPLVFVSTSITDWLLAGFLGDFLRFLLTRIEGVFTSHGWNFPDWLKVWTMPTVTTGGFSAFLVIILICCVGLLIAGGIAEPDLMGLRQILKEFKEELPTASFWRLLSGLLGGLMGLGYLIFVLMFLWLICYTIAAIIPVINQALNWSIPNDGVNAVLVVSIFGLFGVLPLLGLLSELRSQQSGR